MTEIQLMILILIFAAIFNFMDASLGMGYGTTLTVLLLLMDYGPDQIVLPILVSGFISGMLTSMFHVLYKNMSIGGEKRVRVVDLQVQDEAEMGSVKFSMASKDMTQDSKIVIVFTICGIISALFGAAFSALLYKEPLAEFIIKCYITILVMALGFLMIGMKRIKGSFSFKKVVTIGAIAGLNKSISGGAFGPVVVAGQMMIGREGKESIASTALSEALISITGIATFLITDIFSADQLIDYRLIPALLIGACIMSPFAPLMTKNINQDKFNKLISAGLITLSVVMLIKIFIIDM
ncbi:TSUP family transporter [Candidatus Bathyarchaeota archaeon]|nr:TSUP family transporter [Candidatus Bathyarchaeota archaeon]